MLKTHPFWPIAFVVALLTYASFGVAAEDGAKVKTISIATLAPPGSTWMKVFDAWNREIRRRSNKKLQLKFYAGGLQGDEAEVITKIRNGRLDGAAVTAVGLSKVHAPALVFQMPGILHTYAQLDKARAEITKEMDPEFEKAGFHLLGWADVGQSRIFSTHPISKPADLAARKPWEWSDDKVLPAFFRAIKAKSVRLQLPEVLGALQTKRVDTVITTPVAAIALQWQSKVNYMTDLPMAIVIGGTVMGRKQWDSLSEEHKKIMTETATQFHALARRNLRKDEEEALRTLKDRNIKIVTPSAAEKEEWRKVATQVREKLVGPIADRALVDRVMKFSK